MDVESVNEIESFLPFNWAITFLVYVLFLATLNPL